MAAQGVASDAVRDGLRDVGAGPGPVDVSSGLGRPGPASTAGLTAIIREMKFLRLMPGRGEVVLAEGDPQLSEDEERLIEAFRRQLDSGMWAAVPTTDWLHRAP